MKRLRVVLEWLFTLKRCTTPLERERAKAMYVIGTLMIALGVVYATITIDPVTGRNIWQQAGRSFIVLAYILGFAALMILSLDALRSGRLTHAGIGLVMSWVIGFCLPPALNGLYGVTDGLMLVTALLLVGLFFGTRALPVGIVLTAGITLFGLLMREQVSPRLFSPDQVLLHLLLGLSGVSAPIYLFQRYAAAARVQGLEGAQVDRLRLAQITSQVAQRISRRAALQEVLDNAVEQIRAEYPYIYHAQIFLIDEKSRSAQLVASTGEVGRMLIERRHNLPVGSQSVIGQVTALNTHIVSHADSPDSVHRRNEFLPDTVVEAAFPLRLGDTVIGALDLQTKDRNAFQAADIPIFQSLADHIAVAIDNARLFEETERQLQQNQQYVEQMRRSAEEIERLNRRLTGRFWSEYLEYKTDAAFGLTMDLVKNQAQPEAVWTPTLEEAARHNHLVQRMVNGRPVVAVPLRVRGQVIGAMEFELGPDGRLSPEDVNLLQEIGERLGAAAETTRLFERNQQIAQREALVNTIATRLQSANSVEMTLDTAARSLKETLNVSRVAIRLGRPGGYDEKENGA